MERETGELLAENASLQAETASQKNTIKMLVKELERARHPNRGTSQTRLERTLRIRWALDPIDETISILVKAGPNKGIIIELKESDLYERGSDSGEVFPRVRVSYSRSLKGS